MLISTSSLGGLLDTTLASRSFRPDFNQSLSAGTKRPSLESKGKHEACLPKENAYHRFILVVMLVYIGSPQRRASYTAAICHNLARAYLRNA